MLAGAGGDEVAVADDDEGFGEVAVEGDCAEVGADAGGFAHGDGDGGGGGLGVLAATGGGGGLAGIVGVEDADIGVAAETTKPDVALREGAAFA